jgi:uncharacterized membrane protein (UPF0127 family)
MLLRLDGFWNIEFRLDGRTDKDGSGVAATEPIRVFSTVAAVIKDFIRKEDPDEISFSANGKSRIKLYDKFIKLLGRKGYRLFDRKSMGDTVFWYLEKKALVGVNESIRQTVAINGAVFNVETVQDPNEIRDGLMWREHLEGNDGMLFLMPTTEVHEFWMKNTLIPLDMVFIKDERVAGIASNAQPQDETRISSEVPCDRVLEISAGMADAHGIEIGDEVSVHGI